MPITTAICNSYKKELLDGVHRPGDSYMIALFTAEAYIGKHTASYSSENEVQGSGYEEGGIGLQGYFSGLSGDIAYIDWAEDPSWELATLTARGCMIYNASRGNKAIATYEFKDQNGVGVDVSSVNGRFTVRLPPPGASALVRVT